MSEQDENQEDVSELRKAAAGGAEAKKQLQIAKTENAFLRAGIPLEGKAATAMVEGYTGELDTDSIKAEAAEWGIGSAAPATPPQEEEDPKLAIANETQALQEARDAASGAPAPDIQPEKDAKTQVFEKFLENRESGLSMTDATNYAYGDMIAHAAKGTKGARFNAEEWEAAAARAGHGAEYAK